MERLQSVVLPKIEILVNHADLLSSSLLAAKPVKRRLRNWMEVKYTAEKSVYRNPMMAEIAEAEGLVAEAAATVADAN